MSLTRDDARQQRKEAQQRFATALRLEAEYMRSLRHLTRQIDHIVKTMAPGGSLKHSSQLQQVLRKYSETIEPWAKMVAEKMVLKIARKEANAWGDLGKSIGTSLRKEVETAPTGLALQAFMIEQARLITSLPIDAAERVHKLTIEGMIQGGKRANEIAKDVMATGSVTESRAQLIARTEVARTASGLTVARAQHIGVTHYVWRTSGDPDVRESHKKMNGAVIPFNTPPEVEPGMRYHAGMIYNCRCYPDPIILLD